MSTTAPTGATADSAVELQIGGMTCASCAMRIEKKLNKLDGVAATVNYATEKAKVTVPAGYDPGLLVAEVEKTGYTAVLPAPKKTKNDAAQGEEADDADPEVRSLRTRLIVSIILSVPVIAMAMIPALQFSPQGGGRAQAPRAGSRRGGSRRGRAQSRGRAQAS